jgi:ABC-type Fe3+ transport system permease subunit
VDPVEITFAVLLVILLLGLGGYFGWRQIKTLRSLKRENSYSPAERLYLNRQARRRLAGSVLLVVFALLVTGFYLFDIGPPPVAADGQEAPTPAERKQLIWLFTSYWIAALIIFLAIICLALIDLLATRRFTLRQLRQLHDQHQALIDEQAARYRNRRNGPQS